MDILSSGGAAQRRRHLQLHRDVAHVIFTDVRGVPAPVAVAYPYRQREIRLRRSVYAPHVAGVFGVRSMYATASFRAVLRSNQLSAQCDDERTPGSPTGIDRI